MEYIIGKAAGFCYGVKRAVDGAREEIVNNNKKIYCLGEIVHNKEVTKDLEKLGIEFIDNILEIKEKNSVTLIRAHGIPNQTYKDFKSNNLEIKDYTCPNVLKIHEIAEKYSKDGYYIILLGSKAHPENIGTISFCGENKSIIEEIEDTYSAVSNIKKIKINKVLLISQTTYSLNKFYRIEEILKSELNNNVELKVKNTICKATEIRQKETQSLAKNVDAMVIIGGKNSSNTRKLYEIAKENCLIVQSVETLKDINESKLSNCKKIGIMAGASTPNKSIEDVCNKIRKL